MIKKIIFLFIVLITYQLSAQTVSKYIVIDQLGYRPESNKVAVIRDPQVGFDANESFSPGSTYQVVNATTKNSVFQGGVTSWNNGATHVQSGDKCWWFDFTSVTAPGTYYILDVTQNVKSYTFEIGNNVYLNAMKQATRALFYQRSGFAKQAPFADVGWVDGASHIGPLQDKNCRHYLTPNDATSEKDLHGGWYDAGDLNKYTAWTAGYCYQLCMAYIENPEAFGDDYNIPESGNLIPDVLDENKWGIDWLLRMQQSDGSCLSIVGESSASPPSAATGQSLYGPATTNASLQCATTFATASSVYGTLPSFTAYASQLRAAAIKAWDWADANPNVIFDNNSASTNSLGLGAGDQEEGINIFTKLKAAIALFSLTGDVKYKTFVEANYGQLPLWQWYNYVDQYHAVQQEFLMKYSMLPGATPAVAADIRTNLLTAFNKPEDYIGAFNSKADPYRSFIKTYNWGSNTYHTAYGNQFYLIAQTNLDPSKNDAFIKNAEEYLHYIHGVNPLNIVYMTNMANYGAEKSVTQIFHTWFADGSPLWDQVGVSTYGPPPGFIPMGPTEGWGKSDCCTGSCSNQPDCANLPWNGETQPAAKTYLDMNNGWVLSPWVISEVSSGSQADYIRLVSKFISNQQISCPVIIPYVSINAGAWKVSVKDSVCVGGNVQLGPQPTDGIWNWTGPNNFTAATREITLTNITVAQAGVYTATYKNTAGCSSTSQITITVNALPTATITSPASSFCQGGNVILTASAGSSYKWMNGTTQVGTAQTFTATAAGSYTVEVTNAASCKAVSAAKVITVDALPTVTITSPSTSFCQGGNVVLTASAGSSYKWMNGTTQVGTVQTYTATAAGSYTVEVTNAAGCKATSSAKVITVDALPTAMITSPANSFCQGGSVILTASNGSSYKWMNGATQVGTAQTYTATTAGNYTVEVTNANNCKATSAATTVTINALPTATITAGGATTFCTDGSVLLTASTGSSYKWFNGTTQVGMASSFTAITAGSYTVEVTNANGCKATSVATTVTVNALPTATITAGGATTFCTDGSVLLTASTGSSYKWFNGTTQVGMASSFTAITAGSYTVEVTNANGCKATSVATTVTVNALPTPTITAGGATTFCIGGSVLLTASTGSSYKWFNETTQVGTASSFTATTAGTYTVEVTNANGCKATSVSTTISIATAPIWYQDTDNDGKGDLTETKTSCTQPAGYVAVAGDACTSDPNKTDPGICGCGFTEQSCISTATINGTTANIIVIPQPFDNTTTIKLQNYGTIQSITIINASGALVEYKNGINNTEITLGESLAAGLYSVIIQTEASIYTTKIVKQ